MTIYTPELVQRNARFAAGGAFKGLPYPTNPALRVIGCVDSRVDPSDVLGLKLGEAVVMRNIGGRVTPKLCARGHFSAVSALATRPAGDIWRSCTIRIAGSVVWPATPSCWPASSRFP
jgi:carbonic anhydrase